MARQSNRSTANDVIEITKESYDELVSELDYRQNVLRSQIADEISAARQLGDLSENHAYSVAMEKKELNENRIKDLEIMIKKSKIISESEIKGNVVRMGRTIEIENIQSKRKRIVKIVGSEETQSASPEEGKISIDSPIGMAVNNSKIGDEVEVSLPTGKVMYKILRFVE